MILSQLGLVTNVYESISTSVKSAVTKIEKMVDQYVLILPMQKIAMP